MSVQSHLDQVASDLNLAEREATPIATSISTLDKRLTDYFGNAIKERIRFGSSVRNTMLPRRVDTYADVDYMIVFDNKEGYKPRVFLNRLREFAEFKYSRSEIYPSHPTIVLDLNHIKFELVPSFREWSSLRIPAPHSSYEDWMQTDPLSLNNQLENAHRDSGYELKKVIRLLKYWNSINDYVYKSFDLEQQIINASLPWSSTIKECFYNAVDKLHIYRYSLPEYKRVKVERAKACVDDVRNCERQQWPASAEIEIKKIIPSL